MSIDPFGEPKAEPWDGVPRLMMSQDDWGEVMSFAPHFNGVIAGPIPLGGTEPIYLSVSRIFAASLGDAMVRLYESAAEVCERTGHPFNADDWTILSVGGRGCS